MAPLPLVLTSDPQIHRCEAQWTWSPVPHGDYDLWIVLDGDGVLTADGVQHALSVGAAFLFFPETEICAQHNPQRPLRVFSVHFDWHDFTDAELYQMVFLNDFLFFEGLIHRCIALFSRKEARSQEQVELLVSLMVLQFLEEVSAPKQHPVEMAFGHLLLAIQEEPGGNWSVDVMSARLNVSRSGLFRLFDRVCQASPVRYVIRIRIQRARRLLVESSMRVVEIAEALNYSDVYYFSRQFREEAGCSPTTYRRLHRSTS